ncbi:MAG: hypothetical protein Q9219_003049 [cf. Caloplaca sp. 3 TL-2023]
MNPPGMFRDGERQRDYSLRDMLPMSGKLIPEFDGRRNIKDMFARKPSPSKRESTTVPIGEESGRPEGTIEYPPSLCIHTGTLDSNTTSARLPPDTFPPQITQKRPLPENSHPKSIKRSKSNAAGSAQVPTTGKAQQSLKSFLIAKSTTHASLTPSAAADDGKGQNATADRVLQSDVVLDPCPSMPAIRGNGVDSSTDVSPSPTSTIEHLKPTGTQSVQASPQSDSQPQDTETVHDPIQSKDSWSRLFTKPAPPLCEGHEEPCKTMLTKKNGMNRGRSFWMCARPLGPSGEKEKNTQWRCHTFIWRSDWNPAASA